MVSEQANKGAELKNLPGMSPIAKSKVCSARLASVQIVGLDMCLGGPLFAGFLQLGEAERVIGLRIGIESVVHVNTNNRDPHPRPLGYLCAIWQFQPLGARHLFAEPFDQYRVVP